jgi:hypothetical protein
MRSAISNTAMRTVGIRLLDPTSDRGSRLLQSPVCWSEVQHMNFAHGQAHKQAQDRTANAPYNGGLQ